MMKKSLQAHTALFIAQVIYALNYSIAKDLMPNYIAPFALVLVRIIGACILFWSASFFIKPEVVEKKDLMKILSLAVFGVVINQLLFIYGLSLTTPINSSVIMVSNPIVVTLFTLFVLKERLTMFKLSGLLLGIIGALTLLLFKGNFVLGSDTFKGDVMTLGNSVSWAIFIVMVKPYMQKYHTVTVMKWIFLAGLIFVFPIGINDLLSVEWTVMGTPELGAIAFVIIATTFLAYLLNTYALKSLSSSVVSTYIYFQPFLATLFAIVLGKDVLTTTKLISAGCIILGVYLVSMKK